MGDMWPPVNLFLAHQRDRFVVVVVVVVVEVAVAVVVACGVVEVVKRVREVLRIPLWC